MGSAGNKHPWLICAFFPWQNRKTKERKDRVGAKRITPPCPLYQLSPFSSAKKNHPEMPIWDPQNEFPGIPWIGFFLALLYS